MVSLVLTCLTVKAVGHPGLLDVCADPQHVVPVSPKLDDSDWKQPLKVCGTIGGGPYTFNHLHFYWFSCILSGFKSLAVEIHR